MKKSKKIKSNRLKCKNQFLFSSKEKQMKLSNGNLKLSKVANLLKLNSYLGPSIIGLDSMELRKLLRCSWENLEFHHSLSFITIKMLLMQLLKVLSMKCLGFWLRILDNKFKVAILANLIQLFKNTRF
jgi:hypothetical protein